MTKKTNNNNKVLHQSARPQFYCYYGEGAVKQSNKEEGSFLSIVRGDIGQVMDDVFPK